MSTITTATPDELLAARAQLIEQSGLSEDELRTRGRSYTLTLEQITLLDEIDRIDFLVGR